ncbi:MAG: aldolase/citrate lyase family protein [Erythrobacter sp.]
MRSWILVPADNDKALATVANAGANVVVVDLARGGHAEKQAKTRLLARDWLASHREQVVAARRFSRWARVAPGDSPHWREDLEAVMEATPDGIVLGGCGGQDDIQQFAGLLYEIEQRYGLRSNSTRIVPQIGRSPRAALQVPQLLENMHPRVSGLAWDADGLAHSLAARRKRGPGGAWSDPLAFLRAQVLLVARSLGLDAIEAPYSGPREPEPMARATEGARADGFTGMFATHPAHVAPINVAFAPTASERGEAQLVVSAFAVSPHADSLMHKGRRIGQPELRWARAVLGEP